MSAASLHSGPLTHVCGKLLRCRIRVAGNNVSELMKRDDVWAVAVWLDVHDARFRGGSGDHDAGRGRGRAAEALAGHDLLERDGYLEQTHLLKVQHQRVVHRTRLTLGERLHRIVQRQAARRTAERRALLHAEGGADPDPAVAP